MRRALVFALFMSACSSPEKPTSPAVREDAFPGGKIAVNTIEGGRRDLAVTLAVLPFHNNTADKSLDSAGTALAESVSAQLASRRGFKLVERKRIEDLYDELSLGDSGPVDQATAARIGNLLGANVLAFGGFSSIGKTTTLSLRLVKTETGEIVGGAAAESRKKDDLPSLAKSVAGQLADALSPSETSKARR